MRSYNHGGDLNRYPETELDFSVNINPLGMPDAAKEAFRNAEDSYARYPDHDCNKLREELSKKYSIPKEEILCGNGASDLIFRICACFQPKRALVLAPTFGEYERSVRLFGGTAAEAPLREEQEFALGKEVTDLLRTGIDIFFLCNPNNPTGRLAEEGILEEILQICHEKKILLVADECFLDFTEGKSLSSCLPQCRQLLILNAFTKYYALAGLRLGFLLGDAELLSKVGSFGPEWSVSAAAQAAGIGALREPFWKKRTVEVLQAERTYLTEGLQKLGVRVFRGDADFLLLKSRIPLFSPLLKKKILVRNGADFSGLDEYFIRICIRKHEENEKLIAAIREVLRG